MITRPDVKASPNMVLRWYFEETELVKIRRN
jgi:hypothetical protein